MSTCYPKCKIVDLITDYRQGDSICSQCGLVQMERIVLDTFVINNNNNNSNYNNNSTFKNVNHKRNSHIYHDDSSFKRRINKKYFILMNHMKNVAEKVSLKSDASYMALDMFEKYFDRFRHKKILALVSIYFAAILTGYNINLDQLEPYFKCFGKRALVRKTLNYLKQCTNIKLEEKIDGIVDKTIFEDKIFNDCYDKYFSIFQTFKYKFKENIQTSIFRDIIKKCIYVRKDIELSTKSEDACFAGVFCLHHNFKHIQESELVNFFSKSFNISSISIKIVKKILLENIEEIA